MYGDDLETMAGYLRRAEDLMDELIVRTKIGALNRRALEVVTLFYGDGATIDELESITSLLSIAGQTRAGLEIAGEIRRSDINRLNHKILMLACVVKNLTEALRRQQPDRVANIKKALIEILSELEWR